MHDYKIEDTILLLDTSRSMLRTDLKPSRLNISLQTAINFIQTKFMIDPKDRISIITFGDVAKKLISFTYDEKVLIKSLNKIQISGKGNIDQAIAFSLQTIIEEMRKIGGKTQRIFIISDCKVERDMEKLEKLFKIAKGLGIHIDICQLGKPDEERKLYFKRIAQLTNGDYGYFNNVRAIVNAGAEFASKKEIQTTVDYFRANKKEKGPPLISEIALPLRRPTIMEIRLMMSDTGSGQDKCQICHSIKAPITNKDFYSEGRYCPNCDRAMHLSCAAMWAKKSESKKNIFRCPFCYFLLEISESATKLVEKMDIESDKIKIIEINNEKETKMIEIYKENIYIIDASCSYCHNIFLGEFKVFKCKNCESYYHEPCLKKMFNELKACRFCGAKILFD